MLAVILDFFSSCVIFEFGILIFTWCRCAAIPPADSPKRVTLEGSPPNAAMFSCTHFRARTLAVRGRGAEKNKITFLKSG